MMPVGAILLAGAAYSLITGIATDAVPAKWPFEPGSREEHLEAFRIYVYAWSAAAVVGATLVLVGMLGS